MDEILEEFIQVNDHNEVQAQPVVINGLPQIEEIRKERKEEEKVLTEKKLKEMDQTETHNSPEEVLIDRHRLIELLELESLLSSIAVSEQKIDKTVERDIRFIVPENNSPAEKNDKKRQFQSPDPIQQVKSHLAKEIKKRYHENSHNIQEEQQENEEKDEEEYQVQYDRDKIVEDEKEENQSLSESEDGRKSNTIFDTDYGHKSEEKSKDKEIQKLVEKIEELERQLEKKKKSSQNSFDKHDYNNQATMDREILEEKRDLLHQFSILEQEKGVKMFKGFTLKSNLEEMRYHLENVQADIRMRETVNNFEKALITGSTLAEKLNNRFDPFGLRLTGYSQAVSQGIGNMRPALFDLAKMWIKKTKKSNPIFQLGLAMGTAMVVVHNSNDIDPEKIEKRAATLQKKKLERLERRKQKKQEKEQVLTTFASREKINDQSSIPQPPVRGKMKGPSIDPTIEASLSIAKDRFDIELKQKKKEEELKKERTNLFAEFSNQKIDSEGVLDDNREKEKEKRKNVRSKSIQL